MKLLNLLNKEQNSASTHIYEYSETLIIGDMGSGKTVVVLNAIRLLMEDKHVKRVLIFSTPKICKTVWKQEAAEWERLSELVPSMAVCTGSLKSKERIKLIADQSNKILLVSFDLMPWFFSVIGDSHGCDMLVIDESTKLAAGGSQFKAIRRRIGDFHTRVCTTGTPVEENWSNLFYQIMLLDNGASLGKRKDKFLRTYFYPVDYEERKWDLIPGRDKALFNKIKHLIVTLPDYRDELPPLTFDIEYVRLGDASMDYYKHFEAHMVDEERDIIAPNAGVREEKLRQIASGFIYRTYIEEGKEQREVFRLHRLKQEALMGVVQEAQEDKIIVFYNFEEELKRFKGLFHSFRYVQLDPKNVEESIKHWETDKLCRFLVLHPKSASHGLRLTAGNLLIMLSPIWSRDQFKQLLARMHRRGQTKPCRAVLIVAENTVDEREVSVVEAKAINNKLLKQHLEDL